MRLALWLLALFGVAVASALFAGTNPGTVTLFWPPYRVDLSLNLVIVLLSVFFLTLYLALRALSGLLSLPSQARRWRVQHIERSLYMGLLDAMAHLTAGRFIRARKAAQGVLAQELTLVQHEQALPASDRLRALTHLLAAESSHALQDKVSRDEHIRLGLDYAGKIDSPEVREGLQLRAARWALHERDPQAALQRLNELPQGAARRTLALRLRYKVARLAGQTETALELARLLTKHRAFSQLAGLSIAQGLAVELITSAHDATQVIKAWQRLDNAERLMPQVTITAAERLVLNGGDVAMALQWLLPLWGDLTQASSMAPEQRVNLVLVLELCFSRMQTEPDVAWLTRIETAQLAKPRDPLLMYLAGMTCMRLSLWGKSLQMLKLAITLLKDERLIRNAWRGMAKLAEQREDPVAALEAWRLAAR
jgi:HemY protein